MPVHTIGEAKTLYSPVFCLVYRFECMASRVMQVSRSARAIECVCSASSTHKREASARAITQD